MSIDRGRILTHAEERLGGSSADRAEQVDAFRRFLKLETERLRIRHRLGLGGREIAIGRSYLVDLVVGRACRLAAAEADLATNEVLKDGCAVVALGGYGRRELAPFSDVDLLFLHDGRAAREASGFVEQVLLLLWDMGLSVGHSFRTLDDCVAIAREDLHSRNAMAEARPVTGSAGLFEAFEATLDDAVYGDARRRREFLEAIRRELDGRQAKFGRAVCVQEPNLKESAGGLRDLHAVVWAGRVALGLKGLESLRDGGHVAPAEHATARRAYDFVSRVRNECHFATGRRTDLLSLDLQPAVAASLGYEPRRGALASEAFMRDYYRRAHELHGVCESFLTRLWSAFERGAPRGRGGRRLRGFLELDDGRLRLADADGGFPADAADMLKAFATAQAEGATLDEGLRLAIRGGLAAVDEHFRRARETGRAFLEILGRRGRVAPALRAMHESGFLGRLLPEFGRVSFLVQHDYYHRYTVDEHTLAAIDALDEVAAARDPALARFQRVLAGVADAAPLYLAVLLHDIGKGRGGGHVPRGARIAERVCRRLQLAQAALEDVLFLVRSHLLMSQVSQRRDLAEERVIEGFADAVGTPERLDMLLLLTYADGRGVGPGVWNEWKATLLWELYAQARAHLTGRSERRAEGGARERRRERLVAELAAEFPPSEVERHLAMMPGRYLRALGAERLAAHLRLARRLARDPLAAEWRPAGSHRLLSVCSRDSPGLLARLAGTLTANGVDILSVDVYTREDGVALDTFLVSARGERASLPERWGRLEASLVAAVGGTLDVGAAVAAWREHARPRSKGRRDAVRPSVRFDSEASEASTVIEVRAEDQPGLVYTIARTLAGLGLDIGFAKIATEKSHALDVFYVQEAGGGKLGAERARAVELALLEALRPPLETTAERRA
jgi:[protein-PII] uridylyltransferase